MVNNLPNNAPLWLKNVGYFNNAYLGDLIIVKNTIYYVPHTNVEAQRGETSRKIGMVTRHFGLLGLLLNLAILGVISLSKTSGSSPLKIAGISAESVNPEHFQLKLDEFVSEKRKESIDINQLGLIKPLRFTSTEVKNATLGLTTLRFDSAFDNHDFKVGYWKKQLLKDSLWINGFLSK